ncbi:cysteine desulfurase [Candidatus Kaiserbacteria bacterium]|nr:MAG: cysteine desulfurase [Candidatus Kaiserbacteria bacterium]
MFTSKQKRIFLDYAAGTPVSNGALKAYNDASKYFANPQALHSEGLEAARIRDDARSSIAKILGVKSQELIFTSGGTEANNLALAGYLDALEEDGVEMNECRIIVSAIEHPSVKDVFVPFIRRGLHVDVVSPNKQGVITPESVEALIQENTVLVSVALVNSEIGTVQQIHAIGKLLKQRTPIVDGRKFEKILFHTDACQGLYQSLVPQGLGVDLMSLDSGKMFGPRGVGVLYIRRGVKISPVLRGGSQEQGLRPGTENIQLYAGFAAAFEEYTQLRESESVRLDDIRNELLKALTEEIPDIEVNGDGKNQTPHILNISVSKIDSEYVAMYLDQRGLALSTKSACLERSGVSKSHVVAALGKEEWHATSALRFSFGRDTNIEDVPLIVSKVSEAVKAYRSFS